MAEVSEEINRSNTICHYKRFPGFLRANCNACRVGFPKLVDLLRLFAEYGLTSRAVKPVGEVDRATIARSTRRIRERLRSIPPTLVFPTMLGAGSFSNMSSEMKQTSIQWRASRKRSRTPFIQPTILGKSTNERRNGVSEALCTITSMRRMFSPLL